MKQKLICVFLLQVMCSTIIAQAVGDVGIIRDSRVLNPVPASPEMAALGRYGQLDFDKSTGALSHSIPIYTINVDAVALPLQLQYLSDGFRPSDIGSYLGLHWTLGGIGGISRDIKGLKDEASSGYLLNNVDEPYVDAATVTAGTSVGQDYLHWLNKTIDISQDNYSINFPGLSGKVFINSLKQFEYSVKTDNKFFSEITSDGSGGNKIKFWIIDAKGNKYEFEEEEITMIFSSNGYSRAAVTTSGPTAWKIKKIITNTGKTIVFNYLTYSFNVTLNSHDVYMSESLGATSDGVPYIDNMLYCGCSYDASWIFGSNMYSYTTKLISSIVTDKETVEFTYSDDPTAENYNKKLTEIRVKDENLVIRKKYRLDFGYYSGNARLKLTSFKQESLDSTKSIEHTFKYYEEFPIPSEDSRSIDFYNYFNGANNWHLIYSTQPGFLGAADRSVRPEYARQTLLKTIIFPTGGETSFTYEPNGNIALNDFGPGLRVHEIIDKDKLGNKIYTKEYVYNNYQTNINLMINNTPLETFVEYTTVSEMCKRMVLTSDNHFSTAANIIPPLQYYYYKEVDVLEKGASLNIKTKYKYNRFQTMTGDLQIKPEAELKYKYEESTYHLIAEQEYTYLFKGILDYNYAVDQFAVSPASLHTTWVFGGGLLEWCVDVFTGVTRGGRRFQSIIQLQKVTDNRYENGVSIFTEKEMSYLTLTDFPSKTKIKNSKGQIIENTIKYCIDMPLLSPYTNMINKNMLSWPIEQEEYNVTLNKELSKVRNEYAIWHSGAFIKLEKIESSVSGGAFSSDIIITNYDDAGNILQTIGKDGVITSYIWGYKKKYLVAKVIGKSYEDVISLSGIDLSIINNSLTTDTDMRQELNKLRSVEGIMVTGFTYSLLIGITSQIDINGKITYYEYDSFHRLHLIKDNEGKILKRICYNYAGQEEDCGKEVVYHNTVKSGTFTRNNCGSGFIGSSVTYTVPANTYSAATQSGADVLAQADVDANGQEYANIHGNCTPISTTIYAKLVLQNYSYTSTTTRADVVLKFYSDAAGTIPISVSNLIVNAQSVRATCGESGDLTQLYTFNCSGTSTVVLTTTNIIQDDPRRCLEWEYSLKPGIGYTLL